MWVKVSEILALLFMAFALLFMAFAVGGVFGMVVERTGITHLRHAPVVAAGRNSTFPEGPFAQAARSSETWLRRPAREFFSPDPSIDRSLEVSKSPSLVSNRTWKSTASSYARNPLRTANVRSFESEPVPSGKPTTRSHRLPDVVSKHESMAADGPASEALDDSRFASRYDEIPSETMQLAIVNSSHARFIEAVQSETPTTRSHGLPDVVSKHEPVAADGPASEVLDNSRFASRGDEIPLATTHVSSETKGSPRAHDPRQPPRASSAPEPDQAMPWSQIDLRIDEIPSDSMQLSSGPTGSRRARNPPQPPDASSAPEQDQTMPWSPTDLQTMELFDDVSRSGARSLVLDVQNLEYVDSACLGCLVQALNNAIAGGGRIALVNTEGTVQELLRVTQLDRLFPICHDVPTALTAIEREGSGTRH